MPILLLILAAALHFLQAAPPTQTDEDKMQGAWQIVRVEFTGQPSGPAAGQLSEPDLFWTDIWIRPGRTTPQYTLKLDPTKTPKEVDLTAPRLGTQVLKGIYKFEAGQLFICYSYEPDLARPTDFKTTPSERRYLYVLERLK
jgi:uncharacterized protein (TIGR03067 family)